jgi:hypothetical protein
MQNRSTDEFMARMLVGLVGPSDGFSRRAALRDLPRGGEQMLPLTEK